MMTHSFIVSWSFIGHLFILCSLLEHKTSFCQGKSKHLQVFLADFFVISGKAGSGGLEGIAEK